MNISTIYYSVLGFGILLIVVLAIACLVLLIKAHREGRLRHVLSGLSSPPTARPPGKQPVSRAEAGAAPVAPGFGTWTGQNVNPATGLPMMHGGIDAGGNVFGQDNRMDMSGD